MVTRTGPSAQTRRNWLIDTALFAGGLLAALSGIYFLFLPSGGYQGGRNPMYGVYVLFSRHTWDALHTWAGLAMIGAVAIHLAIHWPWVVMMGKRSVKTLTTRRVRLGRGALRNLALNALVFVSFLITAVSGLCLLFLPSSGGHATGGETAFLFSRTTWDLLHTWAGVVLTVAAVVHLAIHWRWIKNVTRRMVASLKTKPRWSEAPAEGR